MKLSRKTLAHRVDGHRLYLIAPSCSGLSPDEYRRLVEAAYGSLEGVEFFELEEGTQLGVSKDYYTLPVAYPALVH